MTRDEAINHIEHMYPADSIHEDTAEIGRVLLAQAEREMEGWRSKPDAVLIRYAELCTRFDSRDYE